MTNQVSCPVIGARRKVISLQAGLVPYPTSTFIR
jgi:hypothetical protein